MREVEAVYEHGLLRPLGPLGLAEQQHVRLTISDMAVGSTIRDLAIVEQARLEVAAWIAEHGAIPSIEEVRAVLASIPGSVADDVIADRGEC